MAVSNIELLAETAESLVLERLDLILERLDRFEAVLTRFEPLLKRYEQASQANGFLAARRALRNG